MIRIGILSFAHHHGEAYISNLRRTPQGRGVELIGVADDDAGRGQTLAAQHNTRYFHSFEDLLEDCKAYFAVCAGFRIRYCPVGQAAGDNPGDMCSMSEAVLQRAVTIGARALSPYIIAGVARTCLTSA